MNTAQGFSEDEFYEFLLRSIPAPMIEMLRQSFIEQTTGLMSFDRWFTSLPNNPEMMQLLLDLYNYDQLGKQEKTAYKIKMIVYKAVKKRKPITREAIDAFSDFIAAGGLDNLSDKS